VSVQFEKNIDPVPIFATSVFSEVIYEYKVKVSNKIGAPNFYGAPRPMWS